MIGVEQLSGNACSITAADLIRSAFMADQNLFREGCVTRKLQLPFLVKMKFHHLEFDKCFIVRKLG